MLFRSILRGVSCLKGWLDMISEEQRLPTGPIPEADASLGAQRRFWLTHIRIGFGVFLAETVAVMIYLGVTPRGPHRGVLWVVVASWLLFALGGLLIAPVVASKPWRAQYSVAWTVLSAFAVAPVAILDVGSNSPILLLLFLPLVYAALMFTPKAAAACGASALVSAALVAVTDHQIAISEERSFMVFAVLAGASVLSVAASINRTRIEQHERRLLATIADLAATDELTKCAVRRVFRQRVEEEISRSLRYNRPLSLMMIDVDQFKSVNDAYGHVVGDHVLAAIGALLQAGARSFDLAGRLGGDEFAMLLPDTEPSGAVVLADRIRQDLVAAVEVEVTLSIGVSGLDRSTPTIEQLFDDADLALYEVKRAGRDAVAVRHAVASLDKDANRCRPNAQVSLNGENS
jgi:diguanylate cyclase (GGDEF)-like protein